MGFLAEYELAFDQLPLVDVAAALPEATLTVEVGQPNQGGPPPFVVRATGVSRDALEDAFEASAFVDSYTLIEDAEGTTRYRIRPAKTMEEQLGPHVDDPERLHRLADNDTIVEHVEVTADGWRQRRWFSEWVDFETYRSFWQDNAEGFSLYRLREAGDSANADADAGLTDRQREALSAAYEMGYFEIPRRAELGDVADCLDISASSLSERLRRAQTHLIESTLTDASGRPLKRPHH